MFRLIKLSEMAPVFGTSDDDKFTLAVYSDEGSVPHAHLLFHGEDRFTNKVCICLHADAYFHNEKLPKNKKVKGLNSDLREELMNYMLREPIKSKSKSYLYKNIWEQLCGEWNDRNPTHQFNRPSEIPHYDEMATSKKEAGRILHRLVIQDDSQNLVIGTS